MNRREARSIFGRPWWTFKAVDHERDDQLCVTLAGYILRVGRIERRTRLQGAKRAGRGIVGYGR